MKLKDRKKEETQMFTEVPISTGLLEDRVVLHLRARILDGQLPDGMRLHDEVLAREFGVSRGPIRDAVKVLAQEGLVEVIPRRGVYVRWVPSEDLREVVMIREVVEQVALRLAMSRESEGFCQALQIEVDKMRLAVDGSDWEAILRAEAGFHDAIYNFSASRRLQQIWVNLRPTVIASFRNDRGYHASIHAVPMAHQRLLDEIQSGDQARAVVELSAHMHPSSDRIGENAAGAPAS